VGGYADWLRQRKPVPESKPVAKKAAGKPAEAAAPKPTAAGKLGFKEKRELAELPTRIELLEAEKAELFTRLADPALYAERAAEVAPTKARLEAIEHELEAAMARWVELEERA
jgi:ATP-binding cassette subfamily F protein uup